MSRIHGVYLVRFFKNPMFLKSQVKNDTLCRNNVPFVGLVNKSYRTSCFSFVLLNVRELPLIRIH